MGCCSFCFAWLCTEKECPLMIIREELNDKSCTNRNAKHSHLEHLICGKISLHISGSDMLYSGVERLNCVQVILFKKAEIWAVNCTLKLFTTFSKGLLHDKLLVYHSSGKLVCLNDTFFKDHGGLVSTIEKAVKEVLLKLLSTCM